jgi:glyoxylase-like metal-dependent hydrolase (beta-lactamase superfamily II)
LAEVPTSFAVYNAVSMNLPDGMHTLSLNVAFEGREVTLHPSAIETDGGLLLLDVGLPGTVEQLEGYLDDAGFGFDDVAMILITHQDGDHAGSLASVLERTDATVIAPEGEAAVVDGRENPRGPGDRERYPPARVDIELDGSGTFNTRAGPARIIETPDHTPDHVSVYLPDAQFLVVADALTVNEDGLAGPRPDMSEDMDRARSSVQKLADLDIDRVLCYHGGYTEEGSDRIAELGQQ